MRRRYMWKANVKSMYNVESVVLCADKNKLEKELSLSKYEGFKIGEIKKSSKHYVTDKNDNEIRVIVLYN